MMEPNFYISKESFNESIGAGFYKRNDIAPKKWTHIKNHFGMEDTIAVFVSGEQPHRINDSNSHHGGIDWLKLEPNRRKGESLLNAYHYSIGMPSGDWYPVYGPYKYGALISHHPDENEIEKYF